MKFKRILSIIAVCVLSICSSNISIAATPDDSSQFLSLEKKQSEVNNILQDNASAQMTTSALTALKKYGEVETQQTYDESQNLLTVTYTIDVADSVSYDKSEYSGEKTAVTYVYTDISKTDINRMATTNTISDGSQTEDDKKSDLTFRNNITYKYTKVKSGAGYVRVNKMTYGGTKITRFLEKNLRNLKIDCKEWGNATNNEFANKTVSRTVASPQLNTWYKKKTGFTHYLYSNSGVIQVKSKVTYSHGNNSYTVSSTLSIGSMG